MIDINKIKIIQEIQRGGQGAVYIANYNGKNVAFKEIFNQTNKTFKMLEAVKSKLDGRSDYKNFVLPIDFVTHNKKKIGYIMELLDESEYFTWNPESYNLSYKAIILIAYNMSKVFNYIHANGFVYQDIHPGNILINRRTLDIKIIDIDNITSETEAVKSTMLGAYPFIAPEKAIKPTNNADTDLYSLSIFYFVMFLGNHPFAGIKFKMDALEPFMNFIHKYKEKFYIFNKNTKNPATFQMNFVWSMLPRTLKLEFNNNFNEGLFDPTKRSSHTDWMNTFSEMYSNLFYCENCNVGIFYDKDLKQRKALCHYCGQKSTVPKNFLYIERAPFYKYRFPISKALTIQKSLFNLGDLKDNYLKIVKGENYFGIKNLSNDIWKIKEKGKTIKVLPNEVAKVEVGRVITLRNKITLEIRETY